jgi:sulfopyruvate decarboxylase TPP-binding subunit
MINQPYEEDAEELYQQAPFGYLTMQSDGLIVNINRVCSLNMKCRMGLHLGY